MRLIGSDGLFAFCVVVCVFVDRFCIVRSCVVSRSLLMFFILVVFECILFCMLEVTQWLF